MNCISFDGLRIADSQIWGGVRLVPLIRDQVDAGLRMGLRSYDNPFQAALVDGTPDKPKAFYTSYIPHGLVMTWGEQGEPVTLPESWLGQAAETPPAQSQFGLYRVVRREDVRRIRMLPLHLAMESLLALHFGGPTVAWRCWSGRSLWARCETGIVGWGMPDLAPTLRLFEIHQNQCGVLLFVDDELASAFVVSHPDDYRQLHASLLLDLYGETLWHHGQIGRAVPAFEVRLDENHITDLDGLAGAVEQARRAWSSFATEVMAGGLWGREPMALTQRKLGRFRLSTFITGSDPDVEQHLGEMLWDRDGHIQYMKTFRLSRNTLRRVRLLETLAAHDWKLNESATALGQSVAQLRHRLVVHGFGEWLASSGDGHKRGRE